MFSSLLDGTTIAAKSPDGKIQCELADGRSIAMEFTQGAYRRYDERELAHQLARLVAAMWAAHQRAHFDVLSEHAGYQVRGRPSDLSVREREYAGRRADITAEGRSESGRIVVSTTGMMRWDVRIKPDTVRHLDEETFLHDAWGAFRAMVQQYQHRVALLQDEIFDLSGGGRAFRA